MPSITRFQECAEVWGTKLLASSNLREGVLSADGYDLPVDITCTGRARVRLLVDCMSPQEVAAALEKMKDPLVSLNLTGCELTDWEPILAVIAKLPKLKALILAETAVPEQALIKIRRMFPALDVSGSNHLMGKVTSSSLGRLEHLSRLVTLQVLELDYLGDDKDGCLTHLARLTELREVKVKKGCGMRRLTWPEVRAVSGLGKLRILHLPHYQIALGSPEGRFLFALSNLESLHLGWGFEDLEDFPSLASFPALGELYITQVRELTDNHLAQLAQSLEKGSLTWLHLTGSPNITDEGVKSLLPLSRLQHLDASHCKNITNTGIAALAPLPSLKTCVARPGTQVTEEETAILDEARKKLLETKDDCLPEKKNRRF